MRSYSIFSLFFAATIGIGPVIGDEPLRFDRDVRPILSDKCFFCHGPDQEHRAAGLRLDIEDEARAVIDADDADASEFIRRILSQDSDEVMPPPDAHKELSAEEAEVLVRWVREGAAWTQHWSFVAPVKTHVPSVSVEGERETDEDAMDDSTMHPIDRFVLARLQAEGKNFSAPADREKLIRRVTFDLTGLPPTIEQIEAFVNDAGPSDFESVVDRLLSSPAYGQRMAQMWMDAARYGDTSVYHADGPREMWAWRDAIVDAYNQNMPFDQFSLSQIAGDLLSEATFQQQLLAGFNRNNGTTDEGGAIAEEYRVEYVVDRVKTTATVWLGLTMECAQCHDHKYDPISQEEYYQFYAYFNVSSDAGMQTRNGNAEPKLDIPKPEKETELPMLQQRLAETKDQLESLETVCDPEFSAWLQRLQTENELYEPVPIGAIVNVSFSEAEGTKIANNVAIGSSAEAESAVDATLYGELRGEAKWVQARQGWALQFDGSSYVDFGDLANFERTDSFSYGGWVNPQAGKIGALLARMDDSNAYRGYDLLVGDGVISVHLIHNWPDNAIKVVTKKKLKPDQWQHVFVTYDGSSKAAGIKIYVNGELWEWKIEQDGLTDTIQTEKPLLIGSRNPGSRLQAIVDDVLVYERAIGAEEVQVLADSSPIPALLAISPEERTEAQLRSLRQHFLSTEHEGYQSLQQQSETLQTEIESLKQPMTSVMIMADMESPRETFVLNRGAYDSPTEHKVEPSTLAVLPPIDPAAPKNRLGLAQWLFQANHPLTSRVAVNRYWQMLFGSGLVESSEDFGAQGEYPSHPELLDWLAVDFQESGWDIKRMLKQIVMSQTYRQTSQVGERAFREDPRNRLMSRGTRYRLQGEFIRDAALSISGLLVDKFGGPGVKPYQPAGLWAEVGLGGNPKFTQDHGEDLYRRSLYTYWKRSAPPPAMQIFDAPTREKCTVRRAITNTPLQALVTLNDTQFVETSRHFAERMLSSDDQTIEQRIEYGFRLATARRPEQHEQAVLQRVLAEAMEHYQTDPQAAAELLEIGESSRNESLDPITHAGWTILASTILNLDETLTRE